LKQAGVAGTIFKITLAQARTPPVAVTHRCLQDTVTDTTKKSQVPVLA
jgi:hypothetical protein